MKDKELPKELDFGKEQYKKKVPVSWVLIQSVTDQNDNNLGIVMPVSKVWGLISAREALKQVRAVKEDGTHQMLSPGDLAHLGIDTATIEVEQTIAYFTVKLELYNKEVDPDVLREVALQLIGKDPVEDSQDFKDALKELAKNAPKIERETEEEEVVPEEPEKGTTDELATKTAQAAYNIEHKPWLFGVEPKDMTPPQFKNYLKYLRQETYEKQAAEAKKKPEPPVEPEEPPEDTSLFGAGIKPKIPPKDMTNEEFKVHVKELRNDASKKR
jgi:hypothetical protein